MRAVRTRSEYALPVSVRDFLALTRREDRRDCGSDLGTEIDKLPGVDSAEYNGHFGAFIYYRVDAEHDTPETHATVAALVDRHLHPRRSA